MSQSSFLRSLGPSTYDFLSDAKPFALLYALILAIFIALSLYYKWSFINFFISLMMGWTIPAAAFAAVLVVTLDIEVSNGNNHVFTTIWGIVLCIAACVGLYYSNKYKTYYDFQCSTFYLDEANKTYHIRYDCDFVDDELYDEGELEGDPHDYIEVKGADMIDSEHELCIACKEWAEEVDSSVSEWGYRRP